MPSGWLDACHSELRIVRSTATPHTLAEAGRLLPDASTALLEHAVRGTDLFLFVITREATAGHTWLCCVCPMTRVSLSAKWKPFAKLCPPAT